jgi:lysophospholipase L1-like esterase
MKPIQSALLAMAATMALVAPGYSQPAPVASPVFTSTVPTARLDYWQKRQNALEAYLRDTKDLSGIRLVFIGDSITDFWHLDANPWFPGQWCGRAIWDESFAGKAPENAALNLGISGDRLEHVLFRLMPAAQGGLGQLDRTDLKPDFLIIMLGINNSFEAESPAADSIYEGIRAAVLSAHARKPGARIILQSLLPTNDPAKNAQVVDPVNLRLAALAKAPQFQPFVTYLDLHRAFLTADGAQDARLFNDGLHPNRDGYRVWRDQLVPALAALRVRPK